MTNQPPQRPHYTYSQTQPSHTPDTARIQRPRGPFRHIFTWGFFGFIFGTAIDIISFCTVIANYQANQDPIAPFFTHLTYLIYGPIIGGVFGLIFYLAKYALFLYNQR